MNVTQPFLVTQNAGLLSGYTYSVTMPGRSASFPANAGFLVEKPKLQRVSSQIETRDSHTDRLHTVKCFIR